MNIAVEHLSTVADQLDELSGRYCLRVELIVVEHVLLLIVSNCLFFLTACMQLRSHATTALQ